MPLPFSEYTSQFFWDFKRMDNVNYNFEILEALYSAKKQSSNSSHFNKPIVLTLMSMIECMLYDFLIRIRTHRKDSLPNMAQAVIAHFRSMNDTDELKKLIWRVKAQDLLCAKAGDTIYEDLEYLNQVRNRAHIQNRYNLLERDEHRVFIDSVVSLSEKCFERVVGILCNVYPRWDKQPLPMADFPKPWL